MQIYESTPTIITPTKSPDSTSLPVVCFSTYVAGPSQQAVRHRDVRNFLLALRGERVSGTSAVPVGNDERSLTTKNANDSIDWFGEMVVQYLDSHQVLPPFGARSRPDAPDDARIERGALDLAPRDLDLLEWPR